MAKVFIPTALRQYAGQRNEVEVDGATVGEALGALTGSYPDLGRQLYNEAGKLRNFVNIYLNEEDVRYLQKSDTPLSESDTISIIPAIAGGSAAPGAIGVLQSASGRAADVELSHAEIRRYSRHLIVPEVGLEGQKKLKASSVLLIGAGGLGAPMAMYLAAAGVGRIGIVDFDVVDESNLQRQVIHGTSSVGKSKLESARERIAEINPYVQVDEYKIPLTSENALEVLAPYDVIADGTDNFPNSLPCKRCLCIAGQAERLWVDISIRGTGVGVLGGTGTMLSLPVSRAASARPCAVVRRGGSTRDFAGYDRYDPGN